MLLPARLLPLLVSICDRRVSANSYWIPRRVNGSQFYSVTDGVEGASVLSNMLLSVMGDSQ